MFLGTGKGHGGFKQSSACPGHRILDLDAPSLVVGEFDGMDAILMVTKRSNAKIASFQTRGLYEGRAIRPPS